MTGSTELRSRGRGVSSPPPACGCGGGGASPGWGSSRRPGPRPPPPRCCPSPRSPSRWFEPCDSEQNLRSFINLSLTKMLPSSRPDCLAGLNMATAKKKADKSTRAANDYSAKLYNHTLYTIIHSPFCTAISRRPVVRVLVSSASPQPSFMLPRRSSRTTSGTRGATLAATTRTLRALRTYGQCYVKIMFFTVLTTWLCSQLLIGAESSLSVLPSYSFHETPPPLQSG